MKVVYNEFCGGFSLSEEAIRLGREISGDPEWRDLERIGLEMDRSDPVLVQVVETLCDKAGAPGTSLAIADVPTGTRYRIDEYDGSETVMTVDDYDWKVAT